MGGEERRARVASGEGGRSWGVGGSEVLDLGWDMWCFSFMRDLSWFWFGLMCEIVGGGS